jgi:hypothetical protein
MAAPRHLGFSMRLVIFFLCAWGPTPTRLTRFASLDDARDDLSLSKVATAFGLAAFA